MNVTDLQVAQFESSPWSGVALLYRRICVLRARGQDAEAARLYGTEFTKLLEASRSSAWAAQDPDGRLQLLLSAEEERVANAHALAALLAPLLADQLHDLLPTLQADHPPAGSAEFGPFPGEPEVVSARPEPGSPPTIADLIEGMLAQERAASRSPASRRAS